MRTLSLQRVVGPIINLVNETHHLYEKRDYAFICILRLLNNHLLKFIVESTIHM